MRTKIIIITVFLLLPIVAISQEENKKIQLNGFIDTYHAVRSQTPHDFMSSRTRFRGEVLKEFGKSSAFVSFNLNQNSILKNKNGFELREAYFDYTTKNWSLRAGRQLIIWGAADGMRITDLISPMDMTEFLARDYDDIRMPVEAIKFQYFADKMKLELAYIPVFKSYILPLEDRNPWAISFPEMSGVQIEMMPDEKPELKFENSELGGRLTFNMSGIDFSLAALHTFNKMPVITQEIQLPVVKLHREYHRMTFVGGDIAMPLGQFVFRAEAAFNINKALVTSTIPNEIRKHNTVNALIGIDWYAPKNWMLSAQISNETILKHTNDLQEKENAALFTFSVSKSLLNNTLKISDFVYIDVNNKGFFSRFSADYSLSDQIHIIAGYDHFEGNEGMFGYYKDNSEIWLKLKYSF